MTEKKLVDLTELREAMEGFGSNPERHFRALSRLRNEWPKLWDAIENLLYEEEVEELSMMDPYAESEAWRFHVEREDTTDELYRARKEPCGPSCSCRTGAPYVQAPRASCEEEVRRWDRTEALDQPHNPFRSRRR